MKKSKPFVHIYIVNEDAAYSASLRKAIDKPGKYITTIYHAGERFISELAQLRFRSNQVHIVFLSYHFNDESNHNLMNGIEILEAIKVINPKIEVVMLYGEGEATYGSYATKSGAFAFIPKNDSVFLRADNIIMKSISHKNLSQKRGHFIKALLIFLSYLGLLALVVASIKIFG